MNQIHYRQPPFYHFSQDSVELAKEVCERYRDQGGLIIMDLFAGCGVVGLEIFQKLPQVKKMILIEKQREFIPFLKDNIKAFQAEDTVCYHIENVLDTPILKEVDLVVANPPYYLIEQGRIPQNQFKKECHFMELSVWEKVLGKFRDCSADVMFLGRGDMIHFSKHNDFEIVKTLDKNTNIFRIEKTYE